jgi:hypothetical protein
MAYLVGASAEFVVSLLGDFMFIDFNVIIYCEPYCVYVCVCVCACIVLILVNRGRDRGVSMVACERPPQGQ